MTRQQAELLKVHSSQLELQRQQFEEQRSSLGALMRAAVQRYGSGELTSQALPGSRPGPEQTGQADFGSGPCDQVTSQGTAAAIASIGPGEPCPGVACSGPGCWNRDTARYGLRRLVLCACAAALQGQAYKRQPPETAARAIRRGAA